MRWPIIRNSLLFLAVVVGAAVAGPFGRKAEQPPSEPVAEETPLAEAIVAAPAAPPMFPGGLPVAVQKTPDGLANLSAQSCNACHVQVHDDWAGSAHRGAWARPSFQRAVERAGGSTACRSCHLPLANQHARLAVGYLDGDLARPDLRNNDLWDATLMSEGVTCAACHVRDGVVVGTRAAPAAPHPVAVSTELASPEFCATCHQLTWPGADHPIYDTYGEWRQSAYAEAGVRCQDCHMPPRAGLAVATRFAAQATHGFTADTGRALSILVDLDRPEVQRGEPYRVRLRVQNTGAGHHVPTGSPFKSYRLQVDLLGEDGKPLAEPFTTDLARRISDGPPWATLSDTRISAGGEALFEADLTVAQKKPAQLATLVVSVRRVVETEVSAPLTEQRIPLPVF